MSRDDVVGLLVLAAIGVAWWWGRRAAGKRKEAIRQQAYAQAMRDLSVQVGQTVVVNGDDHRRVEYVAVRADGSAVEPATYGPAERPADSPGVRRALPDRDRGGAGSADGGRPAVGAGGARDGWPGPPGVDPVIDTAPAYRVWGSE